MPKVPSEKEPEVPKTQPEEVRSVGPRKFKLLRGVHCQVDPETGQKRTYHPNEVVVSNSDLAQLLGADRFSPVG